MSGKTEEQVLRALGEYGALRAARLRRDYGPPPNWHGLLTERLVKPYETLYGTVYALTDRGRHALTTPSFRPPYLAGPSAVTDRAYQMDAVEVLTLRGYTVVEYEYKRVARLPTAPPFPQRHTAQIVRTALQVPDDRMRALKAQFGSRKVGLRDGYGTRLPSLGQPYLYATVSSGGISLPRLRTLFHKHENHIKMTWRTPLLIAVPSDEKLRGFVRAIHHQHALSMAKAVNSSTAVTVEPLIDLLILPLQNTKVGE